ncbi:MAG: hypothetical protein EOP21_03360, partial [Hyphomicrobiales bacterium]
MALQTTADAPPASRKIRRLGIAVVIVVALYSAGWFFVASKIETYLEDQRVRRIFKRPQWDPDEVIGGEIQEEDYHIKNPNKAMMHFYTHKTKDLQCEACRRCKTQAKPCRRKQIDIPFIRFGDMVTADTAEVEGATTPERYALIVLDRAN